VIESARQHGAFLLGAEGRGAFLAATEGCARVPASEAVISCFPEPELAEARYCWLSVPGFACGEGRGIRLRGRPWKEGEAAREDLCDGYAERARRAEAPDIPLACAAACWQSARLRCSPGAPAP